MAKKLNWKEIESLPRVYLPQGLMGRIRKQAKKQGLRQYELGVEVVKAGLDELGY